MTRTARKTYPCTLCKEPIRPGESYLLATPRKSAGGWHTPRYCAACVKASRAIAADLDIVTPWAEALTAAQVGARQGAHLPATDLQHDRRER